MENIEDGEDSLAASRKQKKDRIGAVGLMLVLALAGFGLYKCSADANTLKQEDAYAYCQTEVKNYLKDPDSAVFDAYITKEIQELTFEVDGTGNARNSFSGMNSFSYHCTVYQHENGKIYSSAKVTN